MSYSKEIDWNDGSGDKIYVDPGSGTGNGSVLISSDPNNGSTDRTMDISFSAGPSLVRTLTVTQEKRSTPPPYFWTEAIDSGIFTLTIPASVSTTLLNSVSYSTDNGQTWTTINNQDNTVVTITTPTISAGNKVLWKGIGDAYASGTGSNAQSLFKGSGDYNIGGDIGTMFFGDNYTGTFAQFAKGSALCSFFNGDTHLINAEDLTLSAKKSTTSCYQMMFYGCSNLETAPTILMETIGSSNAMYGMFENCKKLVVAPELNMTTIGSNSLQRMFMTCTSLTTPPPQLKATTLANSCYRQMFQGCSNLETAPILPALTVSASAYYQMFYNCTKLAWIKMMATDISASNCLYRWVSGVAASGTFVKNSSAQWTTTGISGVPSGWTVQTASS